MCNWMMTWNTMAKIGTYTGTRMRQRTAGVQTIIDTNVAEEKVVVGVEAATNVAEAKADNGDFEQLITSTLLNNQGYCHKFHIVTLIQ